MKGLSNQNTGLGTEIIGPEIKYRYRLISIIRSVLDENDLISLCLWNKIGFEKDFTEQGILKFKILNDIQRWNLGEAWRALKKNDAKFNFAFTDTELVRHTLYISLTCKRIAAGHYMAISPEKLAEIKKSQIFQELETVLDSFESIRDIKIPESEIGQLAMELSAGKNGTAALGASSSHSKNWINCGSDMIYVEKS